MSRAAEAWSLPLAAALLALGCYKAAEPLRLSIPDPASHTFSATEVIAPRLSGIPLQMAAALANAPLIGPLVIGVIKNDNGIHTVRELAAALDVYPMYFPLVEPSDAQFKRHQALAAKARGLRLAGSAAAAFTAAYKQGRATPVDVATAVKAAIVAVTRSLSNPSHSSAQCPKQPSPRCAREV